MGRRKIRIERIKETRTRNVTFHKRKLGIMKKAYEISILCGAEVAFIALYEGKASMFCSGDLDTVIAKFAHHRQFKPVDVRYNKEFAAMCAKAKRGDDDDDDEADDGTAEDDSNEAGTSPMQSQVTLVNPEPPFSLAPHMTQQPQYPPPVPQSIPNANVPQLPMIKNEPVSFYAQPMQQHQQQQQQPGLPPHLNYAQHHVGPASHSLHNSPMIRPVAAPGHHSYPGSAHGSPMNAPVSLSVQSTGNGPIMMLPQPMQPQPQHQQPFAGPHQYQQQQQQQQQQQPFAFAPPQTHQQPMMHHAPSPDPTPQSTPGMHATGTGSPMARPVSSALAAAMPALQGARRFSAPTSAPPTPPMQAVPMHNTGSKSPMSVSSSSRLSNASARLPPLRIDVPLEERAPVVNGVVMVQPPRAGPLTALLQGELPDPSSVMGGGSGQNAGHQPQPQQQPAVFTPSIFSPNTAALFRSLSNA